MEASTSGGFSVGLKGWAKRKLLPTYENTTLNNSPNTPAMSVMTKFSATICIINSDRVLPKARRTPISLTRWCKRLCVMLLMLIAGTRSRIKKMMNCCRRWACKSGSQLAAKAMAFFSWSYGRLREMIFHPSSPMILLYSFSRRSASSRMAGKSSRFLARIVQLIIPMWLEFHISLSIPPAV